jgi:hypothetical protein
MNVFVYCQSDNTIFDVSVQRGNLPLEKVQFHPVHITGVHLAYIPVEHHHWPVKLAGALTNLESITVVRPNSPRANGWRKDILFLAKRTLTLPLALKNLQVALVAQSVFANSRRTKTSAFGAILADRLVLIPLDLAISQHLIQVIRLIPGFGHYRHRVLLEKQCHMATFDS